MKKSVFVGAVSAFAVMVSVFVAVPAIAQEATSAASVSAPSSGGAAPAVAARGQEVFTASGTRLGRVLRVNGDGSIRLSVDGAINNGTARIPGDTLSLQGETLTTSLTRAQVVALVR